MTSPFRVSERVQFVSPDKLRANPRNLEVHGDFDPKGRDAWIVDDVAKNGILLPIILKPDGETIEDGHRRVWAAHQCGLKTIPHITLEEGEGQAFMSAQLARELSMHAKCVLYRDRITELVETGKKKRAGNLPDVAEHNRKFHEELSVKDCDEEPKDEHEEAWIELEQVLSKGRKKLQAGVSLLAKIDEWKASPDAKLVRKAGMVASVFRNRGLAPALRLADESDQAGEDRDDDDIPGKESWPALDKRKRGAGKARSPKVDDGIGKSPISPPEPGDIVVLPDGLCDSAPPITDSDRWAYIMAWSIYDDEQKCWVLPTLRDPCNYVITAAVDAAVERARNNAKN